MAGFFGFFNFEKEGPGVSKNGPKKKSFFVFFELFFRNFWKFIAINFVYVALSLPLFTNGIAAVGITNVARNTARDKHSFGLSDFFDTVKKNWKQALWAGIINVLVYALLIYDLFYFSSIESSLLVTVATGGIISMLLIWTMMNFYIWTLMITFRFTLMQIFKNSFKFVFLNIKRNLVCLFAPLPIFALLVLLLVLFKNFLFYVIFLELVFGIIFLPGFIYLLTQFCVFPSIKQYIIDPYYRDHPDEDIEKRKSLGLEVDEAQEASEFNDESVEY